MLGNGCFASDAETTAVLPFVRSETMDAAQRVWSCGSANKLNWECPDLFELPIAGESAKPVGCWKQTWATERSPGRGRIFHRPVRREEFSRRFDGIGMGRFWPRLFTRCLMERNPLHRRTKDLDRMDEQLGNLPEPHLSVAQRDVDPS